MKEISMHGIHGGNIYGKKVNLDFSVNINPLGMPPQVREVLHDAVGMCEAYPDISANALKEAFSAAHGLPPEYLLFGNGASELFMAFAHAMKAEKTLVPIPSFYGYEYALKAAGGEIVYYLTDEEQDFLPGEGFLNILDETVDLIFLANPNNPTGKVLSREYLNRLLKKCQCYGISVMLDESFVEFCGGDHSMETQLNEYPNLIIIRSFTKMYAIPGVRLGCMLCSDKELLEKTKRQLCEWNLSVFAQNAGRACIGLDDFVRKTVEYVSVQRQFLSQGLSRAGMKVFKSEANFILFKSGLKSGFPLYELLLGQGILIRDCGSFKGLSQGFYRVAVKRKEDNERLLQAIAGLER